MLDMIQRSDLHFIPGVDDFKEMGDATCMIAGGKETAQNIRHNSKKFVERRHCWLGFVRNGIRRVHYLQKR